MTNKELQDKLKQYPDDVEVRVYWDDDSATHSIYTISNLDDDTSEDRIVIIEA